MRLFVKILKRTLLTLLILIIVLAIAVQTKPVQNWLVDIATTKLTKILGTKVNVASVDFSLFNKANINGLYVEDKNKDTLLYAGSLSINITNYFFLKDVVELKKFSLEDAVIKMNRKDSVWNYQYIIDKLASKDTTQKEPSKKDFQPREIAIKNLRLIKDDNWRGEIITATLNSFFAKADSVNFKTNTINLNEIKVNKPYVNIQKYKGTRPSDYVFPVVVADTTSKPLKLNIKKININQATLAINHHYGPFADGFDGAHILFSPLNVAIENFKVNGDVLTANLNIKAKERSGLELKKLTARIKWTSRIMELKNLDLITNKSHITNYYAMKFKNFDDDFAEYETMVTMDAHFNNTYVNSDDVAFFAPSLKTWKKELHLSGDFLGTVSDFTVEKLVAKEKNNGTIISGTFGMKGLPDMDKTFISFNNGNIKTNYKDLGAIIPALQNTTTPNLEALGNILFTGNFNGTTSKFITSGTVTTALGSVTTNLSMQLPQNSDALYSGDINIKKFDLKTFLNEPQLGIVDFAGKFDGKSFTLSRLDTKLEGFFSQFGFNGYNYTNVTTNGKFLNKYFNGELKISDPNFHLNGQAEANFSNNVPSFNILADVTKSNLQALNLSKNELHFTGLLDVNFAGTNIDNFLGSAKLLNAAISNSQSTINFDSLTLTTAKTDSFKTLHFASNDFAIDVKGDYKILDLPTSFQAFLHNYYPSYINAPAIIPQNQKFTINIGTRYIEPYLQLFDKNIKGFNDANLTGTIDTKNNAFGLNILLPYGKYKNYSITGADLNGIGNRDSLFLKGAIADFQVSDSLNFPNTNLSIISSNDLSDIQIKTRASNTLNEADLNAKLETSPNGIKINFNPSSFILNDKKWELDKEGEITLYKNYSVAKNVKFIQGFQEVSLETAPVEDGNTSTLDVKLKDVVVGDLASLFIKNTNVEGIANGAIHVDDIFGQLNASAELKVTELSVEQDSIGTAFVKANYNNKTKLIDAKIASPNTQYNFNADVLLSLSDTATNQINTTFDLQNSKIDIVQKIIGKDVFSNINGYATGKLTVIGKTLSPTLLGKIKLKDAGMKVNFTQVYYKIPEADLHFTEDAIDFGNFIIKDTIGNTGTVKGTLYHHDFKKMNFDFDLATNNLLLLNTQPLDNDKFYGSVIGKATLSFKGPEDNCKMTISGEPTELSKITIPNKNSKESGDANFIVFKPIGEEMVEEKKQSKFNLLVDLDILANNKVGFDVILDETSGDVISAKGNGRLRIKVGSNENLDMRGKLNIEEGNYNFNFQSLIRKPFILKKSDNNSIEWNGDPYDANMHIDAMYEAKNVSIKDLIGNTNQSSFNSASRSFRDDVFVVATLSGKLMKPDIKFRFDFPANSPIKNDDVFDRFRKKIEADDNEMIKQVAYLIVFNSFAPYGEQSIAQTNFTSIGVNTISSLVTKEINKTFTDLLYKITKDKSLIFDLSSAVYSSNDLFATGSLNATSTQFDRYNVKIKVGKSFLNNKLRVNLGGDFDINLRSATQTGDFQWLPDWNVQWSLNTDNSLSLVIFNKNSLDISGNTLGRRTRQGVGISYKKDFDRSPFERGEY